MGSHSQAVSMTTQATVILSLLASAAAQLCSTVQDPIKRDEGLGPWNVSRVERSGNGRNGRLVPVDGSHPPPHAFYEGDSYVLQYSVREGRKPDVIYGLLFWFDGMVLLALMLISFILSCYLAGWMLVPVLASMVFGLVGCFPM